MIVLVIYVVGSGQCQKHYFYAHTLQSSAVVVIEEALLVISTLKCLDLDDNNMSQEAIDGMVQVISHYNLANLYKC